MPKRPVKKQAQTTEETTGQIVPVGALIPQPHGGAIRNGGTNKGGPGKPPDEFKAMCRALASNDAVRAAVEEILQDKTHPQFMAALKWATEHGYGQPKQQVEVDARVGHFVIQLPALDD